MSGANLEEIQRKQQALDARMNALQTQLDTIKDLLIGQDREIIEDEVESARNYFDRLGDIESEMSELQRDTRVAVASTRARVDGGNPSKKDIAKTTMRNKLVTNAATKSGRKHKLQLSQVDEIVTKVNLNYQTVKDAAKDLAAERDGFDRRKDESGNWIIALDTEHLSNEIVYLVEEDLERDDLTKRLISENMIQGVK